MATSVYNCVTVNFAVNLRDFFLTAYLAEDGEFEKKLLTFNRNIPLHQIRRYMVLKGQSN